MKVLNIPAGTGMAILVMEAAQSCQPSCVGLIFEENRVVHGEIKSFSLWRYEQSSEG